MVFMFFMFFYQIRNALAFQVDPLPIDNLIQNPWFRSTTNPTRAGLDSWIDVKNYWTLSQKISNPSPDEFISGRCNPSTPTYCGTAAKLAADDGNAIVGVDSYLYQIVPADPTHKKLKFFVHWVAHLVDPFEVKIFGGDQINGPWNHIWTPLNQVVLTLLQPPPGYDTSWLWTEMTSWTPPVETVLSNGYLFYKVEIRAKLPSPEGFKLTGVYFATEYTNDLPPTATSTPFVTPTQSPTPTAYRQTPTPTPGTTFTPTATNTQTAAASPTTTNTPVLDGIFKDNFESGNLSTWSSSASDNGDLIASSTAALFGNYGMQAIIDDTNPIYVTDDTPASEPRYKVRFYFDPNSISIPDKNANFIFYAYHGTTKVVLRVEFRISRGIYQLRASLANDANSWISSNWFTLTDNPHFLELDWQSAIPAGANNGYLTLWIDGLQTTSLSGIDNDNHRIDRIRVGVVAGIDSGTNGTYFFDAFESRRTTYIGPLSE
jgi:hypothetical protein